MSHGAAITTLSLLGLFLTLLLGTTVVMAIALTAVVGAGAVAIAYAPSLLRKRRAPLTANEDRP